MDFIYHPWYKFLGSVVQRLVNFNLRWSQNSRSNFFSKERLVNLIKYRFLIKIFSGKIPTLHPCSVLIMLETRAWVKSLTLGLCLSDLKQLGPVLYVAIPINIYKIYILLQLLNISPSQIRTMENLTLTEYQWAESLFANVFHQ